MSVTIGVTPSLAQQVADWVRAEDLSINVVSDESGNVRITQPEGRQQSDLSTLRVGGWMTCGEARALAAKLDIPVPAAGKLLNLLDIRLRNCELGCF